MKSIRASVYVNQSSFFTSLLLILFIGFFKTYLKFFPDFQGFRIEQHYHGIMMFLWMVLLIIQPLLIALKFNRLHRTIGKLSFLAAPLLITSIFLVSRMGYYRAVSTSTQEALAMMALSVPAMFAFTYMYYLAIFYSHRMNIHMRYMIGTSLLMLGPGLGRFLIMSFELPFNQVVNFVNWLTAGIALLFLIYDIRTRKAMWPYLNVFVVTVMIALIWIFRYSALCPGPEMFFADTLFSF